MKRHVRACAVAGGILLASGMCSPVSAGLVYYANAIVSGTGQGTVPQILNFPSSGEANPDTPSGCVKWTLSGSTYQDGYGGVCPDAPNTFGNDQDNSWSQTRTPSEVGVTSPFYLAVVYNPSEPGSNNDVLIDRMVLTFYDPDHYDPLNSATWSSHSLAAPVWFSPAGSGSGTSGRVFGLDWDQAVAVQTWVLTTGHPFADIRLGLGAEISDHQGHSYYYIAALTQSIPTPEPLSAGLVAAGLAGLILLRRRSRKTQ